MGSRPAAASLRLLHQVERATPSVSATAFREPSGSGDGQRNSGFLPARLRAIFRF
jgi:hypothetical protein